MLVALVFFVLSGIFIFNFFRLNADLVEGHIKQGIIPNLTQGRIDLNFGAVSGNLIHGVEIENVLIQNPHFEANPTIMTIPKISLQYSLLNIFWGNITLEKLLVENPVLTLKRNETGRGIWDFSIPEEEQNVGTDSQKLSTWQKQEQAQSLADNYLTDIKIKNLSILIPAPDQLVVDEFLARLTRFPAKTYQYSGIDLTLKKYPAKDFVSHIFSIAIPENPDFLRFQFTKMKNTGNFTLSFDAIGQNFNFAVENLGLAGRKINFYDGRMKDRLNLEWTLARGRMSLLDKMRGLNGVLRIPDLRSIFAGLVSADNKIEGSVDLSFDTAVGKSFYESNVSLKLSDFALHIPFVPEIQHLSADVSTAGRIAAINSVNLKIRDIESQHNGQVNYADVGNIHGNLNSNIMGDEMQAKASYKRENPGLHRLRVDLTRNSGEATIEFKRHKIGKNIIYRDFFINAGLVDQGKAVDILPLNLMPRELTNEVLAWFDRIDLLGPLSVKTRFKTVDDWKNSELDITFSGAKIVHKLNPKDSVSLNGQANLASGVFVLNNLQADIENFNMVTSGTIEVTTTEPYIDNYSINLQAGISDDKSFAITAERLQKSLGLKCRPDFNRIELMGKNILTADLSSLAAHNNLAIEIKKMRFERRKKPLWLDAFKAQLHAGSFNALKKELPERVEAKLAGKLFGVNLNGEITANAAQREIEKLSLKGEGSNFSEIIAAIISQPEGEAFFKKYPMNLGGAFNFAFLGKGLLRRPELEGWVRFPRLSFSYSDVRADLPFYAMIKTADDQYKADIEAGKAYLKVGPVNFNLGQSKAQAQVKKLFGTDPEVDFSAGSNVFAADLTGEGGFYLNSKKIKSIKLRLKSNKIETLANEIARIGQFKVPFKLAGNFDAKANLTGRLSSPDSKGSLELGRISLDFPLHDFNRNQVLKARNFKGKANFVKKGPDYFSIDLQSLQGQFLDAEVNLDGAAHLQRRSGGLKPYVDKLNVQLAKLQATTLADYLMKDFLPPDLSQELKVQSGEVFGKFTMHGDANRMVAIGEAMLNNVSVNYKALKDSFKNLNCTLKFEGRSDSTYARIGVENGSANFGRSIFKVKRGFLEDPLRSGNLLFEGSVEKVYPKDLLAMFGGLEIPALSFPEEGWLNGKLRVDGTMFSPELSSQVSSSKMTVAYDAGDRVYEVPIGQNLLDFTYNPGSGRFNMKAAKLKLLGGEINVENGTAVLTKQRPFSFKIDGVIKDVDIAKLSISDQETIKGLINGKFKAKWQEDRTRDAVFNLDFKNIYIPKIPLVDPKAISNVGVEFIEKPDFRVGQLNFYVTTQEDSEYIGKLLVADGLFAGPHMRLEIGNSEFNPVALSLTGKLMVNPQSLRKTTLGRKLKKLSATIQDRRTGIPYVDLNLTGTWDRPELMARDLQKKTEKRAKRRFIRKLFGSRGPHKASVEELMQWFPGWKKGM
jgi:hypothetical protein